MMGDSEKGGPEEFGGEEELGRPEQWIDPSEQNPEGCGVPSVLHPPHSSCLGAGSLKGVSQRRVSLRKHLVPLAPQWKPAGQQ